MRNLKRALSLALAAMMLIGMMVVSAGAAANDFTDFDEIDHTEAVNVLVSLNVISGKEDGSYFDPDGTLTRAEMAKLITFVLNGGTEPVLGTKATPTYSDIDGHWAEAYIEYCTSMDIIAGDGTGKFNPEGTLTGTQCAKMLLTAMGYNSDVFGFTGDSWEINTNRYANDAGLYDELGSISASNPISRDDAAQMVYNAIQASMMVRTWTQNQTSGEITETYNLDSTQSLLSEKFGAEIWIGTFDGNTDTLGLKDGYIQVTGKLTTAEENTADRPATFPYDLDVSYVGEEFKVIFKDGTGGTANRPDGNDTIYGVYNAGTTEVLNVTSNDIKSATDYTTTGKIKVDGVEYSLATPAADDVLVVTNFDSAKDVVAAGATDTDLVASAKAAFSALSGSNGDTVKFVLDEDGKVFRAYVTEYKLGTVTAVNSEKVTISGLGSIVIEDNDVYSGVSKNDVVVYTRLYDSSDLDEAHVTVALAESISGTITGYTANVANTSSSKVVLDGTSYTIYNKSAMPTSVGGDTGTAYFSTGDIDETFDLYLLNGYVAAAIQTSESASNYSLVIDSNNGIVGDSWDPLKLVVLDASGTKTTLTVDDDNDDDTFKVGDIVTWTGDASEATVTVETAWTSASSVAANGEIYNSTAKTVGGTVTTTDCVIFVNQSVSGSSVTSGNTYKAYSIRSLKDVDATSSGAYYTTVKDDGKVVAVFVTLGKQPSGATSSVVYGIVTANNGTVKIDDNYYTQYSIAVNDETYEVNVESGSLTKGKIYGFAPTSDDLYDSASDFALVSSADLSSVAVDGDNYDADVVAVKSYDESDQLLTYYTALTGNETDGYTGSGDAVTKAVADDVTIVYVDVDNDAAGDEIGVSAFDSVNGLMNAIIILDDDGVISHIIVETSGEYNVYD